jgi:hypothetical protein
VELKAVYALYVVVIVIDEVIDCMVTSGDGAKSRITSYRGCSLVKKKIFICLFIHQ